jgi:hypothetical protein
VQRRSCSEPAQALPGTSDIASKHSGSLWTPTRYGDCSTSRRTANELYTGGTQSRHLTSPVLCCYTRIVVLALSRTAALPLCLPRCCLLPYVWHGSRPVRSHSTMQCASSILHFNDLGNTVCSLPMQAVPSSHHDSPYWTTNNGAPVYNNNQSLTVGVRGPVLLASLWLRFRAAVGPDLDQLWLHAAHHAPADCNCVTMCSAGGLSPDREAGTV